jgi:DNA-binding NarL/FixJ family response regulator
MKRGLNMNKDFIRLLLADDHPAARAGIRALLSKAPDIEIVGEARDGLEAQHMTAQLRPHILLLDLVMPGPRPAEVERWVRENYPETITLVLTAHDRDAYLADMVEAGAAGYLSKETSAERLIEAIRRAAHGEVLFDEQQLDRARRWRETVEVKWNRLTQREREILTLIVQGRTDKEIAEQLNIKLKTVGNHVCNILEKLEMTSRIKAGMWAVNDGFIDAA